MPRRARRSSSALRFAAVAATVAVTLAAAFAQPMHGSFEMLPVAGPMLRSERPSGADEPTAGPVVASSAGQRRRGGLEDEAVSGR